MTHPPKAAPIFILCSPRACSSVVCAMLGQHPELYGFPELNLFTAGTLGELARLDALPVRYQTGLARAMAQLQFGGQDSTAIKSAMAWIAAHPHWTARETLDHLSALIAPRILVDKSPRTSLSAQALTRAVEGFPAARFVHLTRHPLATIHSLLNVHARTAAGPDPGWLANFYAEFWIRSQEVILAGPPAYRIKAEDILGDPVTSMRQLALWLGIRADAEAVTAMLSPENSPYASPPPPGFEGDGDPGFQQSPRLRIAGVTANENLALEPDIAARLSAISERVGYGRLRSISAFPRS